MNVMKDERTDPAQNWMAMRISNLPLGAMNAVDESGRFPFSAGPTSHLVMNARNSSKGTQAKMAPRHPSHVDIPGSRIPARSAET